MIAFYSRGKCFIVSQSISWSLHAFHLLDDESPKWNILKHFNTKNTCLGKVKPVGILTSACLKYCIGCLSLLCTLRWHSDLVFTFLEGGLLLMQHFSSCYRMSPSEDDHWLSDALNSQRTGMAAIVEPSWISEIVVGLPAPTHQFSLGRIKLLDTRLFFPSAGKNWTVALDSRV